MRYTGNRGLRYTQSHQDNRISTSSCTVRDEKGLRNDTGRKADLNGYKVRSSYHYFVSWNS